MPNRRQKETNQCISNDVCVHFYTCLCIKSSKYLNKHGLSFSLNKHEMLEADFLRYAWNGNLDIYCTSVEGTNINFIIEIIDFFVLNSCRAHFHTTVSLNFEERKRIENYFQYGLCLVCSHLTHGYVNAKKLNWKKDSIEFVWHLLVPRAKSILVLKDYNV